MNSAVMADQLYISTHCQGRKENCSWERSLCNSELEMLSGVTALPFWYVLDH